MTGEMRLLLALCAPRPEPARIAALAAGPLDGAAFLALVDWHRVGGLAWRGLAAAKVGAPAGTGRALAAAAHGVATRARDLAAETARLDAALDAAGIAAVVLKGAPLAMLAYGSVTAKQARDIDLLVPATALDRAAAVLEGAGYRRWGEGAGVALAAWHRFAKDSGWRHPAGGIVVELHTDLTDHPRHLLPGLAADSAPCRRVAIAAGSAPGPGVRTFAPEPLFAYLCVHGALSGWRRLKWLADLAGLMRDADAGEVARLHAAAGTLGAGRAATQGIALAATLLGTPLPDAVADALATDRRARRLVAGAHRVLIAAGDGPFATLPLHVMALSLAPMRGYRRSILRRYLRSDPRGPRGIPYPLARAARLAGRDGERPALDGGSRPPT